MAAAEMEGSLGFAVICMPPGAHGSGSQYYVQSGSTVRPVLLCCTGSGAVRVAGSGPWLGAGSGRGRANGWSRYDVIMVVGFSEAHMSLLCSLRGAVWFAGDTKEGVAGPRGTLAR